MSGEPVMSDLKAKYPLSPRKFWKKLTEKIIFFIIIGAVLGFIAGVVQATNDAVTSKIVWSAIGIAVAVIVIFTFIYAAYVSYYIKTYFYDDEPDFLTIRKGVFTPSEIHVQYLKMQDVYVDQDLLDRIFGIYDVHISSATTSSGIAAHIDGVNKDAATGLKNLFLGKIKEASGGYRGGAGTSMAASSGEVTQNTPDTRAEPVKFSQSFTSESFGLSRDWWISEIAKISIGSVLFPVIVSFWIFGAALAEEGKSGYFFWVWLGLVFLYPIFRFGYLWLWQSHYKYEFGEEFIHMTEGVLSISQKNMPYNSVQDVRIHQSLMDRIFGVADLVIENASGAQAYNYKTKTMVQKNGITIEGLSLSNAKKVADELKVALIKKVGLTRGL